MHAKLALDGIRIFDLTRILAGPTATQMLGDLGADILKIERPGEGDDTRKWGPPFVKDADGRDTSESAYYLGANRNKRSVAIDIASPAGQQLARRLIARSDVVIENFKTGTLARYGLAWDDLKGEHPGLVYCSITGFGQTGPYAHHAGYDYLAQGMGGLMSITGERDGEPMKVGVAVADLLCGMYAATGILAALRHRDRTGEGQHLDMALLDTQVAMLVNQGMNHLVSGAVPTRVGNEHPNIVPYAVFASADGHVILAAGNDAQFRKWCIAAGVPDLAADARFLTNSMRVRHRDDLHAVIRPIFRQRSTAAWVEAMAAVGVPCGPVNDIAQVFADPQVLARGLRRDVPHGIAPGGTVPAIASPIRLSATPPAYRRGPPTLGQHTSEVLREVLDLDEDDLADLRAAGIIGPS